MELEQGTREKGSKRKGIRYEGAACGSRRLWKEGLESGLVGKPPLTWHNEGEGPRSRSARPLPVHRGRTTGPLPPMCAAGDPQHFT